MKLEVLVVGTQQAAYDFLGSFLSLLLLSVLELLGVNELLVALHPVPVLFGQIPSAVSVGQRLFLFKREKMLR